MDVALRNTGIRALGRVPWGTHFCQFYKTRRDLLDILVPYFKAGLDHNEACMWICSDPLSVEEARRALGKAVPDLATRLKKGQIEILPHTEWYLRGGRFGAKRVLKGWADKLARARTRGWEGLRLSGNTFWLEKKGWVRFTDYEAKIDTTIHGSRMLALCTYSLDKCGVQEIIDVLNNHKLTLIRRAGKWTLIESSGRKNVEAELEESQRRIKTLVESDIIGIIAGGRNRLYDANEAFLKLIGCDRKDLEAGRIGWHALVPPEFRRMDAAALRRLKKKGMGRPFEIEYVRKDGGRAPLLIGSAVIEASPLRWASFVIDLSNQKRAEQALRKTLTEVEKRVRLRTSDLAGAVRELRREVAERRRVERILSQRNQILDARFASGINPLVILDRHFNFVRVNKAYASAVGMKVEDFEGHNHFELFPNRGNEEIFKRVIRLREPFLAKAKPFSFPGQPERGVTYWDWTLDPVLDKRGKVDCLVFALNDVTEQTRAHAELSRSEFYTRGLIEASLDPLVAISPAGKIMDVNKATEMATGVPRTELIGTDFSSYFTEPAKAREGYERVFSSGSIRDYPLAIRHLSGEITEVLYNAVVFRDESGASVGVFAAARDITALRAAEQERLRLATAIEQFKDGVSILDLEGRILSANPAFADYNGFLRAEIVGLPFHEVLRVEADKKGIVARMLEAMNEGRHWTCHFTRSLAGGVRELDLEVSPILDGSGRLVNLIAIERDVTQEAVFQERIRQWQKMEALGTLAGGIAHDFNNLLLPILINTELMIDDRKDDDATIHRLSQILEAARRGQSMVKQIIAFSQRKEQGRQPVEILPIIKESLEFLGVSMPKNIRISMKIEVESAMALVDPTQIHQVLANLGANAAYAMRAKGGILEIGLTKALLNEEAASRYIGLKPGEYLRLTVSDTGTGMTPEVASRAFEPFFTTKKTGEGTGMGLAVVHGIVKAHGGHLSLWSEPGKGTIFTIILPLVPGSSPLLGETRAPFPKGTERVLFVDDEDIQVRAMSRLLEHLGYRVTGMTDSQAALELLRRDPAAFDLAIMDQTMPNLSGVELARSALSLRPDLPLILCTGYSETINEEQALAMGIKAFMLKPFSAKEIAVTIRRVLSRKA